MNDLRDLLTQGKSALLVNGMGGIGKTTLAQVYVHEYHSEYKHIAYIEQTTDCFRTDLVNHYKLITNLKLSHEPKDLDDKFADIINALTTISDKPNLLVIDNATAALAQWYRELPKECWHILITSRDHIAVTDLQIKEIGFLSEGEAIALFQKHAQRAKVSEDFVKDLVKQLEYHTLTIDILAKAANKYWTEKKITEALQTDAVVNVHTEHRNNSKIERITSYLKAIFDASTLSKDEQWLLKQFVCLPSYAHDYDTLSTLLCSEAQQATDFLIDTLDALANTSWLQYEEEKGSYKMHRIVKEVVKQSIGVVEKDVESLIANLTDKLTTEGKKISVTETFVYIPYAQSLFSVVEANSESLNDLQNNLAMCLREKGNLKEAKEMMQQTLVFAESHHGTSHHITAIRYSNLAVIYQPLGDLTKAKEFTEKAIAIAKSYYGVFHSQTGIYYSNLATIYQSLGDLVKAKEFTEKAMQIAESHYGTSHTKTAVLYSNIGFVYQSLGDLVNAQEFTEKAIVIAELYYGVFHPQTGIYYANLGQIYKDLTELTKAKEFTEKAIKIAESHYGLSHPQTKLYYSNIAHIYQYLGDLVKAKDFIEKAMKIDESHYGMSHPQTAISYSNLGQIYQALGNFAKAKDLTEKALTIFTEHLSISHPNTKTVQNNLDFINKQIDGN